MSSLFIYPRVAAGKLDLLFLSVYELLELKKILPLESTQDYYYNIYDKLGIPINYGNRKHIVNTFIFKRHNQILFDRSYRLDLKNYKCMISIPILRFDIKEAFMLISKIEVAAISLGYTIFIRKKINSLYLSTESKNLEEDLKDIWHKYGYGL